MITQWNPSEIIIHRKVVNDPVTRSILEKCKGTPFKFVNGADPKSVVQASEILSATNSTMLDKIIAGKQVLLFAPASNHTVDTFSMPDDRMLCPYFARLVSSLHRMGASINVIGVI